MAARIALVTGAGRGIGRASAVALATQGSHVAVTARTTAELDAICDQITSAGGTALAISADLAERDSPRRILEQIERAWGRSVEILVNNAGVGSSANPKPLIDFDDDF